MSALVTLNKDAVAWKTDDKTRPLIDAGVFSPATLESESAQCGAYRVRITKLKEVRIKRLLRVTVESADGARNFLVKIYRSKGILARVKSLVRKSKAEMELVLALETSARGIPAVVPLAAGTAKKDGTALESILVASEVPDCVGLDRYLLDESGGSVGALRERRKIVTEYGRLARNIHDAGVHQDDFDPNNTLVRRTPNGPELLLVDFERVRLEPPLSRAKRAWNLAKLNRIRGISATDRARFVRAYAGKENWKDWARDIIAAGERVLRRDIKRAMRLCMRESRNFGVLRPPKIQTLIYRKEYPGKPLAPQFGEPMIDILLAVSGAMTSETGGAASVGSVSGGNRHFHFVQFTGKQPALVAWQAANALLRANLPVALPAAVSYSSRWPFYKGVYVLRSIREAVTPQEVLMKWDLPYPVPTEEQAIAAIAVLLDKLARAGVDCLRSEAGLHAAERILLVNDANLWRAVVQIPAELRLTKPRAPSPGQCLDEAARLWGEWRNELCENR